VFALFVCAAGAQVYQVGSGGGNSSQTHANQPQSSSQSLGWGSNIQNARLGRAAQLALQHGDYVHAYDDARRAANAAPNDPQLWFLLGYAARLTGKYSESVDAYTHGLHLDPSAADGQSGLAQVYSQKGRTSDAEQILQKLVAANPGQRSDLMLLADLSMRSKDYNGAVGWLNKAESSGPDARSEVLLAICYGQLDQKDLANQYLELAERHAPNNPDVLRTTAGYDREVGNYSDAINALKAIRNPAPDVIAELAYTYQLGGQYDDSARLYSQAAIDRPRDVTLQLSAAKAEVTIGNDSAAKPFLERARQLNPNDYRLHAVMGEIAQTQERYRDAVNEYTAAIAALPANPAEGPLYGIQLHMDLVGIDQALGDQDAARSQLTLAESDIGKVDGSGTNREQFLRLRSLIHLNAGDLHGALDDINQALAIDRQDRDNLQLDGDILMKLGHNTEAIALYKQILSGEPDNRLALTSLGYAYRAAGQEADAEKCFEHLAQANPSSYVPYLALGDLYTAQKEYKKAQVAYSKGYTLAPQNPFIVAGGMTAGIESHDFPVAGNWMTRVTKPMLETAIVLREEERYLAFQGNYQRSAQLGQQAIKVLPNDRDVVVYLGYDLLHLGDYDDLLQLTKQYWDVLPKEPDIPLLAGYVHKHGGMNDLAVKDFTEVLARDPTVVTAYVNRGYMLNDLHQPQGAAADFEAALRREPHDGEAHLGLAYAELDLQRPEAALRAAELAEQENGDSRDVHVIRATAYGREGMLTSAAHEYEAALKFTPKDGALHFGLGNTYFSERNYQQAIRELRVSEDFSPGNAHTYAMLARSFAELHDRDETLRYVQQAEQHISQAHSDPPGANPEESEVLISTGDALSTLGDDHAAMDRFGRALALPGSDRVGVRLAIAQVLSEQGQADGAERQIALASMEAAAGDTSPPTGSQYIAAADLFRSMHEYQISQTYLQRAKTAGAPDAAVRVGLADNDLALGDTVKAQAELSAINDPADSVNDYQYFLAKANVLRQQQQGAQALTAFAQAANAAGDDQTAVQGMIETGADEGLRITSDFSALSDFSIEPVYEDSTVYVLDSKLDAPFAVPSNDRVLLPPPRSSLQTQWTDAFHLHLGHLPPASGFYQLRNARGLISVPSTDSIVDRDTTDSIFNFALNPTIHLGDNVLTFNGGVQETVQRDSSDPVDMDQNLFRVYTYLNTSSFFNAVSVSGYALRESGPFTESNLHSRDLAAAVNFRVGAPWGSTALVTGWGVNDQLFRTIHTEDYYASSYIGLEHRFSSRLNVSALAEYMRAWRIFGSRWAIAQDLRPAGTIDFIPRRNWDVQFSTAYSSTRGFHIYDATQNGFSVSYARPFRHIFRDSSGPLTLQYPIRFSAGLQDETFFNFGGAQSQQFRPYIEISIF
jgi:tetratricopeptide (TPR) repeat protein